MAEITSLQNERVKAVVRLREGRRRQKLGRFLIDGRREISRGLQAGLPIREVFYCRDICTPQQAGEIDSLLDELKIRNVELIAVSAAVFRKMAFGDRAEGVLAVADVPQWKLADLTLSGKTPPLVAVIEGIEKPGNIGAVVRSADGAGLDAVVLADCHTDMFNPNAIRASLGTVLTFPVRAATAAETLAWLREHKLPIYAARVDGAVPYTEIDYRRGGAMLLGSEAEGLSDAWRGDDVQAVSLPMRGTADSLNISATAAVIFYEALRQRS